MRIADRSPRQVNPVLAVVGTLLDLVAGRVTATEVLGLAAAPPVRRRFRFDEDDAGAGAHLGGRVPARTGGSAAEHRAAWKMGAIAEGTWRAALDRVLTGVVLGGSDEAVGGALPLDGIDSGEVDLAGRFAELVDRVDAAVDRPRPATSRSTRSSRRSSPRCSRSSTSPRRRPGSSSGCARSSPRCGRRRAASVAPLSPADVRAMLDARLAGRPTRSSFRSGGLTVCTLVPMRSVPHRVVCLLGMDDEAFPRRSRPDGDDLLAREPHLGERDPRSEDRQLFLDALTAADERLVVLYRGAHERTGAPMQPAVPVGELLDALDAVAVGEDDGRVSTQVTVRHPLQPTDPRNFVPGLLGTPHPVSFDASARAGAEAARGRRTDRPPLLPVPPAMLPAVEPEREVLLQELRSFATAPVKSLLAQRLRVSDPWEDEIPGDVVTLELDGLGEWGVGTRALDALQRGRDIADIVAAERGRGTLPPDPLATRTLTKVGPKVVELHERAREWLQGPDGPLPSEAVEVDAALPDGRRVIGSVTGLRGRTLLRLQYSSLSPKHRLEAWVDLLALVATRPGSVDAAVVVGRGSKAGSGLSRLRAPEPDDAARYLLELAQLRDLGLRTPLPLPAEDRCGVGRDAVPQAVREQRAVRGDQALGHVLRRLVEGVREGGRRPRPRARLGREAAARGPAGLAVARARAAAHRGDHRLRPARLPAVVAAAGAGGDPVNRHLRVVGAATLEAASYAPIDLTAALPTGTTVLEASAGTGKTYTIAGLVTRYVAEGRARIDQVLAVTFGVAATSELRTRVRERLVLCVTPRATPARRAGHDDPVVRHLASAPDEEVGVRRRRLAAALADFDAATVATVHEFCQQVLSGLGIAADTDPHVQLVESLADVVDDVVADLYLRHVTSVPEGEPRRSTARPGAPAGRGGDVDDRHAVLLPDLPRSRPGTEADLRRRYADAVRAEVSRRTRAARVARLRRPARPGARRPGRPGARPGRAGAAALAVPRWCWSTSSRTPTRCSGRCCGSPSTATAPLVLIGDPKQAIYAFRGADVHAYLAAAAAADQRRTLDRNFRSDPAVLQGLAAGVPRGGPGRRRDRGAGGRGGPRHGRRRSRRPRHPCACGSSGARATRRTRAGCSPRRWPARWSRTTSRRRWCAPCRAASRDPARRLSRARSRRATSPCWCPPRSRRARARRPARRRGGVRVHRHHERLRLGGGGRLGHAAAGAGPAAPQRDGAARRAHRADRVATADGLDAPAKPGTTTSRHRLREWAEVLADRGVAALFERVGSDTDLAARVLARTDGERVLTDLRHVVEAMHQPRAARAADPDRAARLAARGGARPRSTTTRSAPAGSTPTPPPCRSPRCTPARAWSSRSCSCRSAGTSSAAHHGGLPARPRPTGRRTVHIGGPGSPGFDEPPDRRARRRGRRGPAAAVRRCHARDLAARAVVGADVEHPALAPAPAAVRRRPRRSRNRSAAVPHDDEPHVRLERFGRARRAGLAVEAGRAGRRHGLLAAGTSGAVTGASSRAVLGRTLDDSWRRTSYSALTRDAHELVGRGAVSEPTCASWTTSGRTGADEPGPTRGRCAEPCRRRRDDADAGLLADPLAHGRSRGRRRLRHPRARRARAGVVRPLRPAGRARRARAHEMLGGSGRLSPPTTSPPRCCPSVTTPWGAGADGSSPWPTSRRPTSSPSSSSSSRSPVATCPRRPTGPVLGDVVGLLRTHLPDGDPVLPLRRPARRPDARATSRCAATSPARSTSSCACGGSTPRRVRRRRPQDEPSSGPPTSPSRPGTTAAARSTTPSAGALPAAGDAVHRCAAPLPAVAAARVRPATHLGGVAYLFLRGMLGPSVAPRARRLRPGRVDVATTGPPAGSLACWR